MGRDVAGIKFANKPAVLNFIPNGNGNGNSALNNVSLQRVEPKPEDHGTRSTSVVECGEKQDVLSVMSMNSNTGTLEEKPVKAESLKPSDNKLSSPVLESTTASNETLDTNPVISKPSSLETETVDAASNYSNDLDSSMTADKPQQNCPLVPRKSQQELDDRKYQDEEDNCSVASSTASSVRSTKFKTTIPIGPTFRSEGRAARRKEFHMKLEEKHKALEAEKQEQAARAKELEQAAIKQLRKTMVYKANPVPSFYREGPPPKAELKKLPVTRAKSPNLARRKSCSDVFISYPEAEEKKICTKARHSLGSYAEGSISLVAPKSKERVGGRTANGTIRVKGSAKSVKETMAKEIPVEEVKENPVEEMKESPVKEIQQNSAE